MSEKGQSSARTGHEMRVRRGSTTGKNEAAAIMQQNGWLSRQPESFQKEVLRRSILLNFAAGEVVYHFGDDVGGIYGLVSGIASINSAPPTETPRLVHIGAPGGWTGEGSFLTRQPRRIELRALTNILMFHLPLDQMDQMVGEDPTVIRNFSQILMMTVDVLIGIVHGLQIPDADRRIAVTLRRMAPIGVYNIPLSQTDIGILANASRKQVNATLQRFSKLGIAEVGYRSIKIVDQKALDQFLAE
ncbi:Crp/Fnr family transcriptional regulator [Rhizobium sp. A37_96]